MLSYIDVFHTMMWVVFACLPLIFLMRASKEHGGHPEVAA